MNDNIPQSQENARRSSPYSSFYSNQKSSGPTQSTRVEENGFDKNPNSLINMNGNFIERQIIPNLNSPSVPSSQQSSSNSNSNSNINSTSSSYNPKVTKYTTNFGQVQQINSPTVQQQNETKPNINLFENLSQSSKNQNLNYDHNFDINAQSLQTFTNNYASKFTILQDRYLSLALRNNDLVPPNHKFKINSWTGLKTIGNCGFMVYFIFMFNGIADGAGRMTMLRKGLFILSWYCGMNILFKYGNQKLYNEAFSTLFANMNPVEIESQLIEFQKTIVPVRY